MFAQISYLLTFLVSKSQRLNSSTQLSTNPSRIQISKHPSTSANKPHSSRNNTRSSIHSRISSTPKAKSSYPHTTILSSNFNSKPSPNDTPKSSKIQKS